MSDLSIRETIECNDGTPSPTEPSNEHVDDTIGSDDETDVGSDRLVRLPRPGDDGDDSFGEDFDHHDSSSPSASLDEANVESLPEVESSRTVADGSHDSPSPKTGRLTQLFANFADEFLDIVEEDAQEAVIAAARAQNTNLGQMVKNNQDIGSLMDEFYDHVSSHDKRAKAESEKVRGEMKSLKRSIDKRDLSNSAFQNDVSDRFASLEQSVTDRLLMLEKIISSRMTRLEKSINGRFACLEQGMNDRFAELEESAD